MKKIIIVTLLLFSLLLGENNSTQTANLIKADLNTKQYNNSSEKAYNNSKNIPISTVSKKDTSKFATKVEVEKRISEQVNKNINILIMTFTGLMGLLMLYGITIELRKNSIEKQIDNLENDLHNKVENAGNQIRKNIEESIKTELFKLTKENITSTSKLYHQQLLKKEFLKNNILYNLNKWRFEKISIKNNKLEEVEKWYNERFYIINKLAYGNKQRIRRTLIELQGSSAIELMQLPSFINFLDFLAKDDLELKPLVTKVKIAYEHSK